MKRFRFLGILVFSIGLVGLTLACRREAPDTRAADEQAIRAAGAEWKQAANAEDMERLLSLHTQDGSVFPPNAPIATGREAMRAVWSQMFANPGFATDQPTTSVEVSRAGDLAYSVGTYDLTLHDPKGKPMTEHGKWVATFKKQPDGSWKIAMLIWNSDQPPAASAK